MCGVSKKPSRYGVEKPICKLVGAHRQPLSKSLLKNMFETHPSLSLTTVVVNFVVTP